jgi:lambda family phage portal protein
MGLFGSLWKYIFEEKKKPRVLPLTGERFDAVYPSRLEDNDDFYNWGTDFNALVSMANPRLRNRVRKLVRNFPPFVRAITAHSAFVIGKGGRFESLATTPQGKPDEAIREEIEQRFLAWQEEASIDGRLHFYELQQLALRQRLETGEFFCLFRQRTQGRRKGQLALQFVDPDRVSSYTAGGLNLASNIEVYDGIEYNVETGERLGYYIQPYKNLVALEPKRYPADTVLHGYIKVHPEQLRGFSQFAPAIILADLMFEYMEAELDGAKMAAKWLAFVTSSTNEDMFAGRGGKKTTKKGEEKRIEELENGIIEYLNDGEDIKLASAPDRVKDNFDRFTKFVLRMIGLSVGVPYEVLSGDYQGINYSTARMSRQDYNLLLEPERFWVDSNFNKPVFKEWLRLEALRDSKFLPGYFRRPELYENALWIPAGMPSPDPLKEGKADVDAIKAGLAAPQDIILARGDDPERVLEKRQEWKKLEVLKGLRSEIEKVSTQESTNPAALEEGEEEERQICIN